MKKRNGICIIILFGLCISIGFLAFSFYSDTEIIVVNIDKNLSVSDLENTPLLFQNNSNAFLSSGLSVVGKDNRIVIKSSEGIFRSIGGLGYAYYDGKNWKKYFTGCTAFVYDKFIISASHCVQNSNGDIFRNIMFLPNMINGKSDDLYIIEKIIRSTSYPVFGFNSKNLMHDWVILIPFNNINEKYKSNITLSNNNKKFPYSGDNNSFVSVAGFSNDIQNGLSLSVDQTTILLGFRSDGTMGINGDTNPGASGGSIFTTYLNNTYEVHGIVSGHSCLVNEFINQNCFTNNINSNFITPINKVNEVINLYKFSNNILENTEVKYIILNGKIPTNAPTLVPTPPSTLTPTNTPTQPSTLVPTPPSTPTPTNTPTLTPTMNFTLICRYIN